jgi:transmembrane sensor
MSDNPQSTSSLSVSDQASAWFARLQADDVGDEERRHFQDWYQAHPQHAEAYENTRKLWSLLQMPAERVHQRLQGVGTERSPIGRGQGEGFLQKPSPGGRNLRWVSLGGLGLLLMLAGWHLPKHWQNWRSDYHTAAGQQLSIDLEDGSRLTLNTDTALAVRYSDNLRKIELLRGEAYFEVSPNKNRPFVVDGGQATARAVGTSYAVRKQADDLRVVVSEGTVEVAADQAEALVHAAEQAEYRQGRLQAVAKLDNDDALAWRRQQTVFHRQALILVLEEVNRYRKGRIVAVNPRLAERVVNGVFNNGDPEAVVAALTATLQAKALRMPGGLVLLY